MSPTPPHVPRYHVRLDDDRIRTIATAVFPDHDVLNIEQLESGKSYNNRVYFIEVQPRTSNTGVSQTDNPVRRLVLKIAGHYFDRRKIENELGCLLLIRKFCPKIPVPEPFAWSETGQTLNITDGRVLEINANTPFADHACILMSRLPGRVLTTSDLDSEDGPSLLRTLARHVAAWRTEVPAPGQWGNLRIQGDQKMVDPSTTTPLVAYRGLLPDRSFGIGAYILNNYQWPLTTSWYPMLAQDALARLKKEPHFAPTWRAHGFAWKDWVNNSLPQYPLCQKNTYVLTHLDFSPRNILVSDNTMTASATSTSTADTSGDTASNPSGHDGGPSLRISAVLDFEFSGFFPLEEEFLNATVRQNDDWRPQDWEVIMREMARLGQKVPPVEGLEVGADGAACYDWKEWEQNRIIAEIIESLAPWDIMGGKFGEQELAERLEKAAEEVNQGLKRLKELSWGG